MDNTADFEVRVASPQDAEAVSALLAASYPLLMAFGYDPILFAVLDPLSVDEGRPKQLHHGVHELGLAVVAAAKQDRDDGKVSARLDNIADQLVPVPDQPLWLFGGTEDPTKGPFVFWTPRARVIRNIEAMPQK